MPALFTCLSPHPPALRERDVPRMAREAAALVRGYAKSLGLTVTVNYFDEADDTGNRNGFVCECTPDVINLSHRRFQFWELAETALHEFTHVQQHRRGERLDTYCEQEAKDTAARLVDELRRDPKRANDYVCWGET